MFFRLFIFLFRYFFLEESRKFGVVGQRALVLQGVVFYVRSSLVVVLVSQVVFYIIVFVSDFSVIGFFFRRDFRRRQVEIFLRCEFFFNDFEEKQFLRRVIIIVYRFQLVLDLCSVWGGFRGSGIDFRRVGFFQFSVSL